MITIEPTVENIAFLKQCQRHLKDQRKNAFLDKEVTFKNHEMVQKAMAKAQFHEFCGDQSTWPSLFYSVKNFKQNPYYKHVPLHPSSSHHIELSTMTFLPHRLFNLESVVDDPQQACNDSMVLRALDEPLVTRVLHRKGILWMMNVPSETHTIDPIAQKVSGRVLTFGLGIGYFVYMAALNPKVTSITVVEKDPVVIEYFNEHLRKYFPQNKDIIIVNDDALKVMNQPIHYDHLFVDTYQNETDGLWWWLRSCEKLNLEDERLHFWIESSITSIMRVALVHVMLNATQRYDALTQECIDKTRAYFKTHPHHCMSVQDIQKVLYDHGLYRRIAKQTLSHKTVTKIAKTT